MDSVQPGQCQDHLYFKANPGKIQGGLEWRKPWGRETTLKALAMTQM